MKDFNFFEPYLQVSKKKTKKKSKPIMKILTVVVVLVVIGAPIFIFGNIYLDQKAITEMETEINSVEMQEALKRVDEKRNKVVQLENLYKDLAEVDGALSSLKVVNNNQIIAIASAIPENVFLDEFHLSEGGCAIEGRVFKRSAVAEFELNMRKSGLFEDLLIDNISGENTEFQFSLSFSLNKGVE